MILDQTILYLEAVLAGAVSANQPEAHVDFVVWNNAGEQSKPATKRTALNSTTPVKICAAPLTQGFVIEPLRVVIYNKDTATVIVTVNTYDGTTRFIEVKQSVPTLKSLIWEKTTGWYIL